MNNDRDEEPNEGALIDLLFSILHFLFYPRFSSLETNSKVELGTLNSLILKLTSDINYGKYLLHPSIHPSIPF